MNARERILNNIIANKPPLAELPVIRQEGLVTYDDLINQFRLVLERIGGSLRVEDNLQGLKNQLEQDRSSGKLIINHIAALGAVDLIAPTTSAEALKGLEKAYMMGELAVAENGAVWVTEKQLPSRLLPFICEHLVLLLPKEAIVPTMHHAYMKIDLKENGFAVFIAGPSKTADIEQSLVIGAHGPRSLEVYLV